MYERAGRLDQVVENAKMAHRKENDISFMCATARPDWGGDGYLPSVVKCSSSASIPSNCYRSQSKIYRGALKGVFTIHRELPTVTCIRDPNPKYRDTRWHWNLKLRQAAKLRKAAKRWPELQNSSSCGKRCSGRPKRTEIRQAA